MWGEESNVCLQWASEWARSKPRPLPRLIRFRWAKPTAVKQLSWSTVCWLSQQMTHDQTAFFYLVTLSSGIVILVLGFLSSIRKISVRSSSLISGLQQKHNIKRVLSLATSQDKPSSHSSARQRLQWMLVNILLYSCGTFSDKHNIIDFFVKINTCAVCSACI